MTNTKMATELLVVLVLLLLSSSTSSFSFNFAHKESKICHHKCKGIPRGQHQKECVKQCIDRSREREEEAQRAKEEEEKSNGAQTKEDSPYHLDRQSYTQWVKTKYGSLDVLERLDEMSKLLPGGVDNYRVAILEVDPQTFVAPRQWDAEQVIYIMEGCGTITVVNEEYKESHTVREGDIMRIPAGAIVYAVNKAIDLKFRVAMLLKPTSALGNVVEHFGATSESSYTSFSDEVLEFAFNTSRSKLEKLFKRQRKSQITKISDEQIQALGQSTTEDTDSASETPQISNQPYNLLQSKPSHSNENGQLYEARSNDYQQLLDLGVEISVANISKSSMMAPHYNSHSTQIAMVIGGSGYFEMACPHQPNTEEDQKGKGNSLHFHIRSKERRKSKHQHGSTKRSHVSRHSAFIIPAGHLVAVVAAASENLEIVYFGVRAENNKRHYLAGMNNVLNRLDTEVKQVAFGVQIEKVEEVLNAQQESVFMPGPKYKDSKKIEEKPSFEWLFNFVEL